jgi:acetyltransferase-like isoleucine patch superfamily enzyme
VTNWQTLIENHIGLRTILKSTQTYFRGNAGANHRWLGTLLIDGKTKVLLQKNAQIVNRGSLLMGLPSAFFHPSTHRSMLIMGPNSKLVLNGAINVAQGASIIVMGGATLEFGDGVFVNCDTSILCGKRIKIGDRTELSWGVEVCDTDHHRIIREGSAESAPIEIGRGVLVGRRSMIMKGVSVGDGAVVAAGAVVTRDVPAASLAAGVPARVIKQNIQWQ